MKVDVCYITLQEMSDILKQSDHEEFMEIYESGDREELRKFILDYIKNNDYYELDETRG